MLNATNNTKGKTMKKTCEKTGIEFEAKSKRQKNHPRISAELADAQKVGAYAQATQACEDLKDAGIQEIETAVAFIRDVVAGRAAQLKTNEAASAAKDDYRKRLARWRDEFNRRARAAGYRWEQVGMDEEMASDMAMADVRAGVPAELIDAYERAARGWILVDAAGQRVEQDDVAVAIGVNPAPRE